MAHLKGEPGRPFQEQPGECLAAQKDPESCREEVSWAPVHLTPLEERAVFMPRGMDEFLIILFPNILNIRLLII